MDEIDARRFTDMPLLVSTLAGYMLRMAVRIITVPFNDVSSIGQHEHILGNPPKYHHVFLRLGFLVRSLGTYPALTK